MPKAKKQATTKGTAEAAAVPTADFREIAWADPRRLFPSATGGFSIPYNPSVLVRKRGLQTFHEMRKDDQIKNALKLKTNAILSGEITFMPPEGESEDHEPTVFLKKMVSGYFAGSIQSALRQMATHLVYGFSVTEKIYGLAERGELAGKIVLKDLKTRSPFSIDFDVDEFGNLKDNGIIQTAAGIGGGRKNLPKKKFIVLTNEYEFGNYYGTSDLEAAWRAYWTKDNAYRWLAVMLERVGIPWTFFFYDPKQYPTRTHMADLENVVKNIGPAHSGIIPRASKEGLEAWTPELAEQAASVFKPILEMLNSDMARALLMPSLIGSTPDGSEGSYARSKTHFDVFLGSVDEQRCYIEESLSEGIAVDLIDLNFGPQDAYPKVKISRPQTDRLVEIFRLWSELVSKRVAKAQTTDEEFIRRSLGMPEMNEEERETDAEPEPGMPGGEDDEGKDDNEDEGEPKKPGKPEKFSQLFSAGGLKFSRKINRYEAAIDFSSIASEIETLGARHEEKLSSRIEAIRADLLRLAVRVYGDAEKIAALQSGEKRKAALAKALDSFLTECVSAGASSLRRDIKTGRVKFSRAAGAQKVSFIPADAMKYVKAKGLSISGGISNAMDEAAKRSLLASMKNGETIQEAVTRMDESLDPFTGNADVLREGEPIPAHALERVIRTELTEAYNMGRLTEMRDPEIAPVVAGVAYSAIIDDRTTDVCRFLDGKVFRLDDPMLTRLTPPNHYNCRSILVPVTTGIGVGEDEFITAAEAGKAIDLSDESFV